MTVWRFDEYQAGGTFGENEALLAETPNAPKKSKGKLTEADIELSGQPYSFNLENRTDRIAALVYSGRLLVVTDTMFEELRGGNKADEISVSHTYPFILPDSQGLPQRMILKPSSALSCRNGTEVQSVKVLSIPGRRTITSINKDFRYSALSGCLSP